MFFAGAVAGVDDDAGLFPSLDETGAGCGVGELDDEVVEIAEVFEEVFEEGGGVGLDFLEEGAAVDDLAARVVEERGKIHIGRPSEPVGGCLG